VMGLMVMLVMGLVVILVVIVVVRFVVRLMMRCVMLGMMVRFVAPVRTAVASSLVAERQAAEGRYQDRSGNGNQNATDKDHGTPLG
jgi:hypothetical protein